MADSFNSTDCSAYQIVLISYTHIQSLSHSLFLSCPFYAVYDGNVTVVSSIIIIIIIRPSAISSFRCIYVRVYVFTPKIQHSNFKVYSIWLNYLQCEHITIYSQIHKNVCNVYVTQKHAYTDTRTRLHTH